MVREHNEDSACADPEGMYFVVADGMGGHAAGEVASEMAVDAMRRSLDEARPQVAGFAAGATEDGRKQLVELLEESVQKAHQAVFDRGSRESDKKGMGTTLDVLLIADGEAFLAHVGDSRVYLLRSGSVAQVTRDHTMAEVMVHEGQLTPEAARLSPLRTILWNAVGVSSEVHVELTHVRLRRGDKFLLCSDGLHDYFPSELELADLLAEHPGEQGLETLVSLAKDRGGHDNITGVLVEVVDGNPSIEEEAEEARKLAQELAGNETGPVPSFIADEPTMPSKEPETALAKGEKASTESTESSDVGNSPPPGQEPESGSSTEH
jgi:protein phosphatase